ncbi:MAG: peptidylprolyl isomerase [Alphaproteobacteria bacterium]|nr:peptidylprolyl isomerase [Alphaproteobacteria bacterium]
MSHAKAGDTVKVHYAGSLADGTEFDSSNGREPLQFTIGAGQVIPGFDAAATGMAVGDKKTVEIPCADAYGEHDSNQVQEVDRAQIPAEIDISPGARLQASAPDGAQLVLTVVAADDDKVTLDANHPLAGKDLTFEIEMVAIS